MADYYSILKKTITALPEKNGAARRGVYSRARNAIVNQLKAYEPPLSPSEITAEQLRLEEAIRKVEAEAARESLGLGPSLRPQTPPVAPPAPPARTVATPSPPPSSSQAGSERPPEPAPAPLESAPAEISAKPATPTPSPLKDAVAEAEKLGSASHQAVVSTKQAFDGEAEPAPETRKEPSLATPPARDMSSTSQDRHTESDLSASRDAEDEDEDPKAARRSAKARARASEALTGTVGRQSFLPMLLMGVLVLIAVSIAGLLYSQREMVAGLIGGTDQPVVSDTSGSQPVSAPETPEVAVDNGPSKNADRLLDDSGEPAAAPDARSVTTTLITPEEVTPPAEEPAPPLPEITQPELIAPDSQIAALPNPAENTAPVPADPAAGPQAQRVILYEEGDDANGSGTASQGEVVWSLERETDLEGREQAVLTASVRVPERNLAVDIRIKPNEDTSLPASHLVEIKYEFPEGFSSGDVVNVPGLVMKPTEEARGDALLGASVKVSPGYFWIALSSLSSERERNLGLLRERGWIDIPMLFDTGKRGILTLEKGPTGASVVEQAVTAWQTG